MTEVTVGIDIGTTSVKAVAADGDGRVVARARVPHERMVSSPGHLAHHPDRAWREGVRTALGQVAAAGDALAVAVAAMVPSLCAVDGDGRALTPGLLYGDTRAGVVPGLDPAQSGELTGFLRWCAVEAPGAAGFWPAQAMANHALAGEAVLDTVTAMTAVPLFDYERWDPTVAAEAGVSVDRLPRIVPGEQPAGRLTEVAPGALLGGGTVDAFAEQLVAGADRQGDVLVICGATLITWAVIPEWREVPGLWTVPHTASGLTLIGGPSNAGGLFLDWARDLAGSLDPSSLDPAMLDPRRVPVWTPYVRGERTPLHDPDRRAAVHDLDLTHGPVALVRAAYEAAGFVVRHHLDLAGVTPERIVATGGGTRSESWVQALADATGLPVDVVAVAEGAALGTAFMARVVAGRETSANDARRWARIGHRVEPAPAWAAPVADRYARFRSLTATGRPSQPGG